MWAKWIHVGNCLRDWACWQKYSLPGEVGWRWAIVLLYCNHSKGKWYYNTKACPRACYGVQPLSAMWRALWCYPSHLRRSRAWRNPSAVFRGRPPNGISMYRSEFDNRGIPRCSGVGLVLRRQREWRFGMPFLCSLPKCSGHSIRAVREFVLLRLR